MTRHKLVPLTLALLILALFWWTRTGEGPSPRHEVDSDVRRCTANLQAIYDGLRAYDDRFGHPPGGSGVSFFAALVSSGIWPNTPESIERLTCPGPGASPVPPDADLNDLTSLSDESSAYAGRDIAAHPLLAFPSGGPDNHVLVACDNAQAMNHDGAMNVLFSDRTIQTIRIERLVETGVVPAGTDRVAVGPDSPVEALRVLTARGR